MTKRTGGMRTATGTVLLLTALVLEATAQVSGSGRLEGTVRRADGVVVAGAAVSLDDAEVATTDSDGRFALAAVAAGTHELVVVLGALEVARLTVEVRADATTTVTATVGLFVAVDELAVTAPSLHPERLVSAPAPVTLIQPDEIALTAAGGQLPLVLQSVPGVEITQGGLWDFNVNTWGLNSSLNRRIAVRIDDRDPSIPLLGSQEWAALSYPLDDFAAVELVRGPASSLYGANAFNGVLSLRTLTPEESAGGLVRLTGGSPDTGRVDARWAGELGDGWWLKVLGGGATSGDFARSRDVTVEYEGLALERVPLELDEVETVYATLRLDKVFDADHRLSFETGRADLEGVVQVAGAGRVQQTDTSRPWARVDYRAPAWQAFATWTARRAEDQLALNSGARLWEDSDTLHAELRGGLTLWDDRLHGFAGASYTDESVDSANASGHQSLLWSAVDAHRSAVFAQADLELTTDLTLATSLRWDASSLHDDQLSPQVALVYDLLPGATARLAWRRGFQAANYSELQLWVPVAAPADLSAIEEALAPWLDGQSLGLDSVPRVAAGNATLAVETIEAWELGFAGALGTRSFLTVDYHASTIDDFVTDLMPQLGAYGRLNSNWGPYLPPVGLPPEAEEILAAMAPPLLTNAPDGSPSLVLLSYTNFGTVDIQGVEVAERFIVTERLSLEARWSWLDFEVRENLAGDRLLPNAPERQWGAGAQWHDERFDAGLSWRHVEAFDWAAGTFVGRVPEYDAVDASASVALGTKWQACILVSNLLDDRHYELFGGDLLERRALAWVARRW